MHLICMWPLSNNECMSLSLTMEYDILRPFGFPVLRNMDPE